MRAFVFGLASVLALTAPTAAGSPSARVGDAVLSGAALPGKILPPGAPTVLVCGVPAARAGDLASVGGAIVRGSATVFIAGRPAARLGDATGGGGGIIGPGCPTVLIGG